MNVGEYCYIKNKRDYGIGRIKALIENNNVIVMFKNFSKIFSNGNVISSPQIIDLIEVGDYVNGSWVNVIKNGKPYHEDDNDPYYSYYFENDDIKTIVTHEQMETMQYRVEE